MKLTSVRIRNFRCLKDVSIPMGQVTALIGPNGSGKSAVIRALEFFFGHREVDDDDCWGGRSNRDLSIEVSLTLTEVPDECKERLVLLLDESGTLTITRRSEPAENGRVSRFIVTRRQIPDFRQVRQARTADEALRLYRELRADARFADLRAVRSRQAAVSNLERFEREHPELLQPDEDEFPDAQDVLGQLLSSVFVPAISDPSTEAIESPRNVLGRLIELVVRPQLAFDEPLQRLRSTVRKEYDKIVRKKNPIIRRHERALTKRLDRLAPGTGMRLQWEPSPLEIVSPRIKALLQEAGFPADVGRQGHGVQRAYIVALLQELAEQTGGRPEGRDHPLLLLAIEEPELYQHPARARLLAQVLWDLAKRHRRPAQVVYATHSPFFVSLEQVEALRLLRLRLSDDTPETHVSRVDLEMAAEKLRAVSDHPARRFTAKTLRARLRPLTELPLSEGFFAHAVVLVEGEEDRALLLAQADLDGLDLDAGGIAVLPVGGKGNLDRPLVVFQQLGIPTYVMFDGDAGKPARERDTASNKRLLRLVGGTATDDPETQIHPTWACFAEDLARTVRSEIGEKEFSDALKKVCRDLGFKVDQGKKNSVVLARTLRRLGRRGRTSRSLAAIVRHVRTLASA
jgi:energy-coupling factor transporter ATP-binding protein EcfA2